MYGPILSLVPVEDTDHAIRIIAERYVSLPLRALSVRLFVSNIGCFLSPTPLVIYLFTSSEGIRDKCAFVFIDIAAFISIFADTCTPVVLEKTASGTLVLNDTYQQLVVHEMPFGGSGESGCTSTSQLILPYYSPNKYGSNSAPPPDGSYLGKSSFDTFTQLRSYVHVPLA